LEELGQEGTFDLFKFFSDVTNKLVFRFFVGADLAPEKAERFARLIELTDPEAGFQDYHNLIFQSYTPAKRDQYFEEMTDILKTVIDQRVKEGLLEQDFLNYLVKYYTNSDNLTDYYEVTITVRPPDDFSMFGTVA
jgi:hypothetical protein